MRVSSPICTLLVVRCSRGVAVGGGSRFFVFFRELVGVLVLDWCSIVEPFAGRVSVLETNCTL